MPAPDQTTTPCERQHPTDLHADVWDARTPTITPASTRAGRVFAVVKRADGGVVEDADDWGVRRPRRGTRRGLRSAR